MRKGASAAVTRRKGGDAADSDILRYSVENVKRQIAAADPRLGFYTVRFYVANGRPSREATGDIGVFYYYPSGGTLRDREMNIIFYEPRLDMYHRRNASE